MGSSTIDNSKSSTWSALNYWKESKVHLPHTPSEDSNLMEKNCDMLQHTKETGLTFGKTCVSISEVSDIWNEIDMQYFSPSCTEAVNVFSLKDNRMYGNGRTKHCKNNSKKSEKYNHKRRRMRHVLEGFPDPPLPGATLQKHVDRQYRIGATLSTDSDDVLQQNTSFLLRSKSTNSACIKLFESNPMDFEYFDKVVRSEDEAQQQLEWRRNRRTIQPNWKRKEKRENVQRCMEDDIRCHTFSGPELCPDKCTAPFHEEMITGLISEGQYSATILTLLQAICSREIRQKRSNYFFSSLSSRSYDFLTQFCSDNLMVLNHNKQNESFSKDEKHYIQVLLIKLLITSLVDVLFNPDYIIYLQNNNVIHLSLVALLDSMKWAEEKLQDPPKDCDTDLILQESVQLTTSFIRVIRLFHVAGDKLHRRPGVKISYMVCDWFCMENGAGVIDTCLSVLLRQAQKSGLSKTSVSSVTLLLKEIGKFLSTTGVCEIILAETQCTKRTVTGLTTMYQSLFKYFCDFANLEVTQVTEGFIVPAILECLSFCNKGVACLHPHVIWEDLLNVVLMYSCKAEAEIVRNKVYQLLEMYISHYFRNHSDTPIIKATRPNPQSTANCCSTTDSDSAFYDPTTYASDISIEDKTRDIGEDAQSSMGGDEYSYLEKYKMCLLTTNKKVLKQTLHHILKLVKVCPLKIRVQLLKSVIVPTLEELSDISMPLTGFQTHLVQQLFYSIERMVDEDVVLGVCCARKQFFKTILKFATIEADENRFFFADDAYQCGLSFVRTEVKRCLSVPSVESASLPTTGTPLFLSSHELSQESDVIGSPYDFEQYEGAPLLQGLHLESIVESQSPLLQLKH